MKQSHLACILFLSFLVNLFGCSLFVPSGQTVSVQTIPPNAQIRIDGNPVTSPYCGKHNRSRAMHVYVEKDGYSPYVNTIDRTISTTGTLDIIGTWFFIFPIFGICGDGFYTLEETNITAVLIPLSAPKSN